jgi:hypothetical protein
VPRHLLSPPCARSATPHAAILTKHDSPAPAPIAFHPPDHPPDRVLPPPNHFRHHILNQRSRPPPQKSLPQRQDAWLFRMLPVHTDDYILSLYIDRTVCCELRTEIKIFIVSLPPTVVAGCILLANRHACHGLVTQIIRFVVDMLT